MPRPGLAQNAPDHLLHLELIQFSSLSNAPGRTGRVALR